MNSFFCLGAEKSSLRNNNRKRISHCERENELP